MIRALPVSGLPHFAAGDMDRDSRIDLPPDPTDAILSVREFVRSAAEPVKFAEKTGNTLSTLQTGAGLKTVIQKADGKNFTPPNPHFLLSFFIFLCFFSLIIRKISSASADILFTYLTMFRIHNEV